MSYEDNKKERDPGKPSPEEMLRFSFHIDDNGEAKLIFADAAVDKKGSEQRVWKQLDGEKDKLPPDTKCYSMLYTEVTKEGFGHGNHYFVTIGGNTFLFHI